MNRKKIYLLAIVVTVLVVISVTWVIYTSESKGVIVRFAVELNDHSAAFWVALDKGWFREKGIVIEYKTFSTGLKLAAALTHGDVDIAIACIGPLLIAYDRGIKIKLVSMIHNHGYAIVVNPDMIKNISDLNEKTITASGPGSPTWLLLKLVEEKYNLSFNILRNPPFIATSTLLAGKVDASSLPEHYVTLAEHMGAKVLLRSQDIWPDMPGSGLAVTEEFLVKHRDIVVKIVEVIEKAVQYIKENPDEAAVIVAKHLASDVNIMKESMSHLEYTVEINMVELKRYIGYLVKFHCISHNISLSKFVENLTG